MYYQKEREIRTRIHSALVAAVNDSFRRQCITPEVQFYLYYKPGEIAFWIGPEPLNDEWVRAEKVPNNITPPALVSRLFEAARSLPILPTTD